MIKAIVVDIGGVLVLGDSSNTFKKLANKLGIDNNQFHEKILLVHKKDLYRGKISLRGFCKIIEHNFKVKSRNIIKYWRESYLEEMHVNQNLVDFLTSLNAKYRLAIISNTNPLHAEVNRTRNLLKNFDPVILSYEVGLAKPDKEIFEIALEELKIISKYCIFIDDLPRNIEMAKNLGFRAIQFFDNQQCINQIKKIIT